MRRFWNLYLNGAQRPRPGRLAAARDDLAGVAPAYVAHRQPRRPARRGRGLRRRARARGRAGHAQARRGHDPRLLALADDGDRARRRPRGGSRGPRRARLTRHGASGTRSRTWPRSREQEFVIERGEGPWVFDADGRRYLDATASLWYANIGHGARRGRRRRRGADRSAWRPTTRSRDVGNRPANELCERARRARADGRRQGLPHQRRRRLDRGRGQARPPPLHPPRPARARAPDLAHAGLPRHARLRHLAGRHRGQRHQLGPARPAGLDRAVRLAARRWRRRSRGSAPIASRRSSASR